MFPYYKLFGQFLSLLFQVTFFFSPCLFRTMSTKLEKVMKELDSEVIVVLNNGIIKYFGHASLNTHGHLTTLMVANSQLQ